jgi:hypothetical protein
MRFILPFKIKESVMSEVGTRQKPYLMKEHTVAYVIELNWAFNEVTTSAIALVILS